MTARTIRVGLVERLVQNESLDQLDLKPGVNVVVGNKDTGKTGWLRTISFLLGDTDAPENALGAGVATKFDAARLRLHIGPDEEIVLERRWKEAGAKHKVFIDGAGIASTEFSEWIHKKLDIPRVRFPKGNPYSGATWPELSWRMLFRHVYREERFWSDLADKQPEREQHACLLQFLGAAKKLYPEELGEEIRLRQELLRLKARRDQFEDILQQAAKGLLADPSLSNAVTRDSIASAIERLREEVEQLGLRRQTILTDAINPTSGSPQGVALDLQLAEQRVSLMAEHERKSGELTAVVRRIDELTTYRTNVSAELSRLKRVAVAEEVFRPLSVTRCPHCDQKVSPGGVAPGTCFVCHQHLAWEPASGSRGATRRLAFEHEQLEGETEELDDLVERLQSEQAKLKQVLQELEGSIAEIDVRLRPTRAALAAAPPVGLEATATRVGQVEERIAQLLRLKETLDQRDKLTEQIDELEARAQTAGADVEEKSAGVAFEKMSQALADGINEYLNLLKEGDPSRWTHERVRFRIGDRSFKLWVGDAPWSSVGGTSIAIVLLAYHYALLKLSGRDERNYPGLTLIDFPITLADGSSIANKENYLVEPFVALAKGKSAVQSIICGRSFKGLKGAHRIQLDQVWAQGAVPALTFEALPPAGPRDLNLTVAAHFHSGQAQIMMVLDHGEVARLAKLLPDLGADIAAGRTWPGKDVTIRWSGGTYVTKLVHHIDNGNVKFTVRKRDAKRLWDYLDEVLQEPNPAREFEARYSLGTPPVLDEFFVDFRIPPAPS